LFFPTVAIAGSIAPCQGPVGTCSNASQAYPEISGFVFTGVSAPVLTIVSPRASEIVSGTDVTVRYSKLGDLTGVDHVHFSLDGAPEVRDLDFDGTYVFNNVAPGPHTITGYMAHADHTKVPGTDVTVTFRTTLNKTPVVNAGADQSVGASASLSATATDDGL